MSPSNSGPRDNTRLHISSDYFLLPRLGQFWEQKGSRVKWTDVPGQQEYMGSVLHNPKSKVSLLLHFGVLSNLLLVLLLGHKWLHAFLAYVLGNISIQFVDFRNCVHIFLVWPIAGKTQIGRKKTEPPGPMLLFTFKCLPRQLCDQCIWNNIWHSCYKTNSLFFFKFNILRW